MCGIAGIFNQDGKTAILKSDITTMIDEIFHRGPDEGKTYVDSRVGLGFRRLSIIDIENGSQPMKDAVSENYIIFNDRCSNLSTFSI